MLTSASIDAAVGTVAAWQATPYALAPKPGSLLAKLCEHTRLDGLTSLNDFDNVDTERLYRNLSFVANGLDPMQMSDTEHSVIMDDTVKFLVGHMRTYLNHTRTVAGPAIAEIVQMVEQSRPDWYQPPTLAQIDIWNPPDPFVGDAEHFNFNRPDNALLNLFGRHSWDFKYDFDLSRRYIWKRVDRK